jgi:hypothetical protein
MPKIWFVSYRRERPPGSGHARMTETFEGEAEAKAFARTLSAQESDINAGTINPHMPKEFFGSAKINEWLEEPIAGDVPSGD